MLTKGEQMKRTIISALLVIASAFVASAQESKPTSNSPVKSVTKTLRAAGNFNTFLSLLERAGLNNLGLAPAGFVGGAGPNQTASESKPDRAQAGPGGGPRYQTVFAPNDAAFAKLPQGALAALKKDPKRLRSFLLRHMVPGKLTVKDMAEPVANSGKTFKSADGSELSLIWSAGIDGMSSLHINGKARVGKFQDVMASDYLIVIHEIDAVLMADGSV
jgi:hypothetical protein